MTDFIVVGSSRAIVMAILQAIRSSSHARSRCIVLGDESTDALGRSSHCERHIIVQFDGSGDDNFVAVVSRLTQASPQPILIPADCDATRIVNRVRSRLQLEITPVADTETLDLFDDKWRFFQFCEQHALSVPPTRFVGTKFELDFDATVSALGLPFVIKPLNQSGSLGVQIVTDQAYFDEQIRNNDAYRYHPLIVQRYIDGADIDLSLLSIRGQLSAFAIQQARGSEITFLPNPYLEKVAGELCRLSSYHGLMHIDARLEKATGKVFLIESNPRFWVSLTASVWCGLNFVAECIEPDARSSGVRALTNGTAYIRHPMLRPSSWPTLLSDSGARGRLLRAIMFDWYTFGKLVQDLPVMLERLSRRINRSDRSERLQPEA